MIWGDRMLKIKKYIISKSEMAVSMEFYENDKLKNYLYTYKIRKSRKWITLVRWDNLDGIEHMDIYDENGNYVRTKEFPKRSFDNLLSIIKTFRRNIIAMEIDNI